MQEFISIPTIESGIYMFGGHLHTVNGGWSFFEQSHQVIEVMVVTSGYQLTEIQGMDPIKLGPGDAILISPGTKHTNRNASLNDSMTYMCLHFDFEDVQLRSQIVGLVANKPINSESTIAQISRQMLEEIVHLSSEKKYRNDFEVHVEIEISLLRYLKQLSICMKKIDNWSKLPFSDNEATIGRNIAMTIEDLVNNDDQDISFTFQDVCNQLHISEGYGYRVFKKVYGMTPLHFIDREKYRKAQRLLKYSGNTIEIISQILGAANVSIFSKQFKKWSGITPSAFRKQNQHERHVSSKNQTGYFE